LKKNKLNLSSNSTFIIEFSRGNIRLIPTTSKEAVIKIIKKNISNFVFSLLLKTFKVLYIFLIINYAFVIFSKLKTFILKLIYFSSSISIKNINNRKYLEI
jgi:hypothetical protein